MLQVGLSGEFLKIYLVEENEKAEWTDVAQGDSPSVFTWYKVTALLASLGF